MKNFMSIDSVSGNERKISEKIISDFEGKQYEIKIDNVGNVIVHKNKIGKKVMFLSHIDEVGIQILKRIDSFSYAIKTLGNIQVANLINQRIKFENGVVGVVYAKDGIEEPKKISDLILFSGTELQIGNIGTFYTNLLDDKLVYISHGIDNKFCAYGLIEELLNNYDNIKYNLYCVFSTQEELGFRGAKIAISSIKPDVIVNLDTTPICDFNSVEFEKGVAIKISDSIGVSNLELKNSLEKLCIDNKIKYQYEVSECGTTDMIMVNETDNGSKVCGISLPTKYLHTANSIVFKSDYSEYKKLIRAMLLCGRKIFDV